MKKLKMKKDEAVKVAYTLNDAVQPEPPIDVNKKVNELIEEIRETFSILEPEDILDGDGLEILVKKGICEKTGAPIMDEVKKYCEEEAEDTEASEQEDDGAEQEEEEEKPLMKVVKTPKEEPKEDVQPLIDLVCNLSKMRDLKDTAKNYDEFRGMRSDLTKFKKTEELKAAMVALLKGLYDGVEEEENKEEQEDVVVKKEAEKEVKKEDKKEESNQDLADRLHKEKAEKDEIKKAFFERYKKKGQTDSSFIEKRIVIYMKLAKQKQNK